MKVYLLHIIRAYLRLGLFFYFKTIRVFNAENIPKDKPVLFLANHQNALLDPLLIETNSGRLSYYLTRAGVFKKQWVSKLLNQLRMLPVYRIRDGWSNLTHNNPIFEECSELLSNNKAVVIFPEGSHNLRRTVRPLSKGFTRIVFNTLEKYPETDLQLVPVGLNFVEAESFGDSVSLYFGDPIDARSYLSEDRNHSISKLKQDIHNGICELTTHIESEGYNETLQKLRTINVDFLDPNAVNRCISNNFKDCKHKKRKPILPGFLLKGLLIINLLIPYMVWKLYIEPKIKEIEFKSTFRFVAAITIVPLYLILVVFLLYNSVGITLAMLYLLGVLILAQLAIKL